jgi:FlaG/FlaF family flagellin (archaellin)
MKTTTLKPKELKSNHRAVAPVIATLLMVAIAVVGGTIIFVFSQGFFSSSQISGTPQIEALSIAGYDATDSLDIVAHEGTVMAGIGGAVDNTKIADERVAVYVTNDSVQKITIAELRFSGTLYNMTTDTLGAIGDYAAAGSVNPADGEYVIILNPGLGVSLDLTASQGEIQPGQTVTVLIGLDQNIKIGRDTQFNLKTTNGNVILGTVNIGQQSG